MQLEKYKPAEVDPTIKIVRSPATPAAKQHPQLLMALALLLVVLAVVVTKNREFWFGSDEVSDSDFAGSEDASSASSAAAAAKTTQAPARHATPARSARSSKASIKTAESDAVSENTSKQEPSVVTTKRVVIPPLDVEVVAGDTHRTFHANNGLVIAETPSDSNRVATLTASPAPVATNAGERERLTPVSAPELRQTIDATYPLLGAHARVQGSVVMEAIIGANGTIEGLRVISGPAILSLAAQQAVREWRFKPVLQNGQAVETKARITVNFSIRISDNPPTAS